MPESEDITTKKVVIIFIILYTILTTDVESFKQLSPK